MCFAASIVTAVAAVLAVEEAKAVMLVEKEAEVTAVTAALHIDAAVYVSGEKHFESAAGDEDDDGACERKSRPLVARYATPVTRQVMNPPSKRF